MSVIHIGSDSRFLTLRIHGRTKPEAENYWDSNWLHCTADASAGPFRSTIEWQLRNEDLARFMHGLENLDRQRGEALLQTGDGWLDVRVGFDDRGQIEARCQLDDNTGGASTLEFRVFLDKTILPALIGQLRAVLGQFPVIGRAMG